MALQFPPPGDIEPRPRYKFANGSGMGGGAVKRFRRWVHAALGTSAVFAALAQNPKLIEPMRAAYNDLHRRIADDGLPPGVSEAVAAALDGLWLDWVLGLAPLDQERVVRVRRALEDMLARSRPERECPPDSSPKVKPEVSKR